MAWIELSHTELSHTELSHKNPEIFYKLRVDKQSSFFILSDSQTGVWSDKLTDRDTVSI